MTTRLARRLIVLASLSILAVVGCSGGNAEATRKQVSHVRAVAALYFRAHSALGKNPENEQEFKNAVSHGKMDLDVLGVSSVDELFISDRDGQPLVIVYGQQPKGVAPGVIAYEQTGKDGVRLVGTSNGQVIEADAARFAELVKSPPG
jgi:hypothetical protein